MKLFNINNWDRKEQYLFFKDYKDPFFNVTVNIDVTKLSKYCKKEELSFGLAFLHQLLLCTNSISNFKLRIKENTIYTFDTINIGTAVLKEDNTFIFCYFPFKESIFDFIKSAKQNIDQQIKNPNFNAKDERLDLIHSSILPWINFTAIKHARKGDEHTKGIPKFMIGKTFKENNKTQIPISIEVHHGLMDGYHAGKFIALLENNLNNF